MNNGEYNNNLLSYSGRIGRKNYVINMLILVAIYVLTSLTNFKVISDYFAHEFFGIVLLYLVELLKFVVIVAIISVIYRRVADFADFRGKIKNLFFIFYFFPFIYLNWGHFLLDFMPKVLMILDVVTLFIVMPVSILLAMVIAFLKRKHIKFL